jgi:hypothetical protein
VLSANQTRESGQITLLVLLYQFLIFLAILHYERFRITVETAPTCGPCHNPAPLCHRKESAGRRRGLHRCIGDRFTPLGAAGDDRFRRSVLSSRTSGQYPPPYEKQKGEMSPKASPPPGIRDRNVTLTARGSWRRERPCKNQPPPYPTEALPVLGRRCRPASHCALQCLALGVLRCFPGPLESRFLPFFLTGITGQVARAA